MILVGGWAVPTYEPEPHPLLGLPLGLLPFG
ncbi:hypothetical protein ThrDRAFT_00344 [Frankia casuarinae]|nr:hypothetical protein CcI6DRAFT_00397 [Frankia sp. CcI6]EYT93973.1 hypothetical protein ThrDRAFT_00344 [Frankia casuarinae]KDA44598.1 hypothetical protein BMG523Draft_00448 [Frankia sp. BMG5.23]OAA27626.1 hypothetical protein AAY23_102237 [Frankia casuarinae]